MKKKEKKIMGQQASKKKRIKNIGAKKLLTLTTAAATLPNYSTASSGITGIEQSNVDNPCGRRLTLAENEVLFEKSLLCDVRGDCNYTEICADLTTYQGEKIVQTSVQTSGTTKRGGNTATKRGENTAKTKGKKKGRKSGGKKAADKKRLKLLRKVNAERKERLNKKYFFQLFDASTSDEQVLIEVMNDHLDFFKQLRGIINSTTSQEQDFKEQKLKEILEPTLKTFTMHILRHDYQFVNATLNEDNLRLQKERIEDAINKLNPVKKSVRLYGKDVVTKIQSNILKEINRDSLKWYNNKGDTGLSGNNIIQFLREASKDYVGVLFGEQNIMRAAILDTSLAGEEIRKIANSTKNFFEGKIDSKNRVGIAIIERFKEYVETEIKRATKNNNLSKLSKLKELYTDVHIDKNTKSEIIDEVKLLWSIFDLQSVAKFKQSAQETDQQKWWNLEGFFKKELDFDALLNKLKFFQGKDEGTQLFMEFITLITKLLVFSRVAVAILNLRWFKSGNGASEPASQEPTKSKGNDKYRPAIKAPSDDDLIEVFQGDKNRFWIINKTSNLRGQYYYRMISTGAHSHPGARTTNPYLYWELKNTKKNIIKNAKGEPAPVGTIGTDGKLT